MTIYDEFAQQYLLKYDNTKQLSESKIKNVAKNIDTKYLEIICKIIKENNVEFSIDKGNFVSIKNNTIMVHTKSIEDEGIFFHEIGHLVDSSYFNAESTMSNKYNISTYNKNLTDIIKEEVDIRGKEIFDEIISECEKSIINNFSKTRILRFRDYCDKLNEMKQLEGKLDSNFVNNVQWHPNMLSKDRLSSEKLKYFDLYQQRKTMENYIGKTCCVTNPIYNRYLILVDAIEHKYPLFYPYKIVAHGTSYYNNNDSAIGEEFFANMFCAELVKNKDRLLKVQERFPKSYSAFYMLFDEIIGRYLGKELLIPYGKQIIKINEY